MIIVGLGKSKRSSRIKNRRFRDMKAFAGWLTKNRSGADDGPNFVPAPMHTGGRSKEAAEPASVVCLDLDRGLTRADYDRLCGVLAGYSAILYETRKSTANAPRARVVVEAAGEVSHEEYPNACTRLAEELGRAAGLTLAIDESCTRSEQLLFTPVARREVHVFHGAAWSGSDRPKGPRADLRKVTVDFEAGRRIGDGQRNDTLASIAGSLRRAGLSADEIAAALQQINENRCKPPLQPREVETIARSIGRYRIDEDPPALAGPEGARATLEQLMGDPYEPPVIVEGYLLEDVAGFAGPGGLGKSTLLLREHVHVVLGLELYSRRVVRPGPTLYVSAEDAADVVWSRVNWICRALQLSDEQKRRVLESFYVEDISATSARLLRVDRQGRIEATEFLDELIEKYAALGLSAVALDPTSLIGPGETSGNDGMAELMRTGRRLARSLGAAVRFVHHVGQAVARSDIADQYAGRGGTAFADNSRMNQQLRVLTARRFTYQGAEYELPEVSDADLAEHNVLALYVHKLSYQRRDPTPIVLRRRGFAFDQLAVCRLQDTPQVRAERTAEGVEKIVTFVTEKLQTGIRLSLTNLASDYKKDLAMSRDEVRKATRQAIAEGRLEETPLPRSECHGRKATYLRPPAAA